VAKTKKHKYERMADAAWIHYQLGHSPADGFSDTGRQLFLAGYARGQACVRGFAWIYCTLASVVTLLAIIAVVLWD
jgi:hypothetical protein